jgi:hypothetical protein
LLRGDHFERPDATHSVIVEPTQSASSMPHAPRGRMEREVGRIGMKDHLDGNAS